MSPGAAEQPPDYSATPGSPAVGSHPPGTGSDGSSIRRSRAAPDLLCCHVEGIRFAAAERAVRAVSARSPGAVWCVVPLRTLEAADTDREPCTRPLVQRCVVVDVRWVAIR